MSVSITPSASGMQKLLRLSGALGVIALVWLVVLPWAGRSPEISAHIARQQRLGIDPSAMFYSELEIVPAIAHRVERLRAAHPSAFWSMQADSTGDSGHDD